MLKIDPYPLSHSFPSHLPLLPPQIPPDNSKTLKFPNRFIASLARPGNRLESLSVKNALTGEMCRNLSGVCLVVCMPIYVYMYGFVCVCVCLFVRLFVCLFVCFACACVCCLFVGGFPSCLDPIA
jgi:hypothetical protein